MVFPLFLIKIPINLYFSPLKSCGQVPEFSQDVLGPILVPISSPLSLITQIIYEQLEMKRWT